MIKWAYLTSISVIAVGLFVCVCVCVPEQADADTEHDVVERVEAHHAHQQILQDNLRRTQNSHVTPTG